MYMYMHVHVHVVALEADLIYYTAECYAVYCISSLTAVLCRRAAASLYLSFGMEQCCRMASVSFMWLISTANCQCWGRGTSESTSDTTYITSASGTSLGGRRGWRSQIAIAKCNFTQINT